jgi:hypothetical protein
MRAAVDSSRVRAGISFSGALSLFAVVAVLVVVSVPRLRELALQENEADAQGTAQILARALKALDATPRSQPSLRELMRYPELRGLGDTELLAGGAVLRRHGYLFEITCLSPALTAPAAPAALLSGQSDALCGLLAIRAWPWDHGSTGSAAFLVTQKGGRLAHSNASASWEGLEAAGDPLLTLAGWRSGP